MGKQPRCIKTPPADSRAHQYGRNQSEEIAEKRYLEDRVAGADELDSGSGDSKTETAEQNADCAFDRSAGFEHSCECTTGRDSRKAG